MRLTIVAGDTTDVTNLVTSLKWSGSRLQVSRKLEFTLMQDKRDKHIPVIRVDCGYTVIFYDDAGNNVFEGNIYDLERNRAESRIKIVAYDHLIVMTHSKTTRKFTDVLPEEITRQLCRELGVIEGNITETGVKVSFTANNKTGFEIIMMAYTEAHKKNEKLYHLVMEGPKLNVIEKGSLIDGLVLDSTKNMINSVYKKSIESLINQVCVVDEQGNIVSYEKDDESIEANSMFQVTYKIDPNKDTAKEVKALLEKNKPQKSGNIIALGDYRALSSYSITLKDELFTGQFYIKQDTHTFEDGKHEMNLELEFENLMNEKELPEEKKKKDKKTGKSRNRNKDKDKKGENNANK